MFDRIVSNPGVLSGKPCIAGTRISVEFIIELIASGGTIPEIVKKYPQLSPADVEQALRYAAAMLRNDIVIDERLAG